MKLSHRTYQRTALGLFFFVFGYILLRAFFTEPLHDEIATFYFYIYQGRIVGPDAVVDANNHWLNSFLGYGINKLFGESLFLVRLPNVLSFIVYFLASYGIVNQLKIEWHKIVGLAALICIPFTIEYFAYTRGYGIGLAFFMLGLYALLNYVREGKKAGLVLLCFSLWVSIFANLIFLNSALVIVGYLLIYALIFKTKRIEIGIFILVFLLSVARFVLLAFELKSAGAFYYGSLDGLWDVTGKSLAKMVLFTDGLFAFILVLALLLLLLFGLFKLFNSQWKSNFMSLQGIFLGLFFGSIFLVLVLALGLKINYPEDRTGMPLIPLFLLSLLFVMDAYPGRRNGVLVFLFFPITFIVHLSLHSSIYSPDQRLSTTFYKEVRKQMTDETTIASYHMNIWTWNWNESFQKQRRSTLLINYPDSPVYDIILAKRNTIHNPEILKLYDTIAVDQNTHDVALKRKNALSRTLVKQDSTTADSWVDWEYYNLMVVDSLGNIPNEQAVQLTVEFDLQTFTEQQSLEIVLQTFDANNQQLEYMFYPIGLVYRNQLVNTHLKHHFVLPSISVDTKTIKIFVWNKDKNPYEVKNVNCYLYLVKN